MNRRIGNWIHDGAMLRAQARPMESPGSRRQGRAPRVRSARSATSLLDVGGSSDQSGFRNCAP